MEAVFSFWTHCLFTKELNTAHTLLFQRAHPPHSVTSFAIQLSSLFRSPFHSIDRNGKKTANQLSFLEERRRRAHDTSVGSKFQRGRLCPFFPTLPVASSFLLDSHGTWAQVLCCESGLPSCNLVIWIQFLSFSPLFLFSMQSNLHCFLFNCLEMPNCFGSASPQRRHLSQVTLQTSSVLTKQNRYSHQQHFVLKTRLLIWLKETKQPFPLWDSEKTLNCETEGRCSRTKDIIISEGQFTDIEAKW